MLDRTTGYANYRTTKVLWAASLPSEWDELKLKAFADFVNRGSTPDYVDESRYRVVNQATFSKGRFDESEIRFTNVSFDTARGALEAGDVLLASTGGGVLGKCHLFMGERGKYVADSHVTIIRDKQGRFIPAFLHYCLSINYDFIEGTLGQGATNQTELQRTWLRDTVFPFPDLDTQNRIVRFLDEKTAEIDAAIAKKRRLIELLNEQKAILINRAVTKGLNPDAPMKDSGVDWIGEIPAHWEVKRLKYLFRETNARTSTGKETLFSLRMHAGLVPHDEVSDKSISDGDLIDYKHVAAGQMVMNRMRAAIGIFGVARADGLVSPDYAIFDISDEVNADYFLRLFKTTIMGMRFRLSSKGLGTGSSGFMRLYTENFGDLKVAIPPMSEQAEISSRIDELAMDFEQAVALTEREISTLNEFRQTLIANAVTGKIKI